MKKGFTLIELLVVVLIIGILAAVALPQYTKAVEKSRTAEAMTLLGDIMTAQRIYKLSNTDCAASLDVLDIEVPSDTTNFTIAIDSTDKCKATAARKGGAYNLAFTLNNNGTITRECSGGDICKSITNSNEWVTYTGTTTTNP